MSSGAHAEGHLRALCDCSTLPWYIYLNCKPQTRPSAKRCSCRLHRFYLTRTSPPFDNHKHTTRLSQLWLSLNSGKNAVAFNGPCLSKTSLLSSQHKCGIVQENVQTSMKNRWEVSVSIKWWEKRKKIKLTGCFMTDGGYSSRPRIIDKLFPGANADQTLYTS